MKRVVAMIGGGAVGVAAMLGILQPWKRSASSVREAVNAAPLPNRLSDAYSHLEEGRVTEARELLRAELAENSLSAAAYVLLAWADLQTGDMIGGQRRLANAASIDPDFPEISLFQGHFDMMSKNYRAAVRSYSEALKLRPNHVPALTWRATARYELGEFAGAVEDSTSALSGAANDVQALYTRAAAFAKLARWEESIRDWTAYLVRHPKDSQAWTNRGNANERLGRRTAAMADWDQAARLAPHPEDRLVPLDATNQ
jgi:tetratricopeptide (TPR) repeat protein